MPSLKEVRNRIVSVASTQQITKAMKMVAAAKLRRAQDRSIQIRPYSQKLASILNNIMSSSEEAMSSDFTREREANKVLIVVVTSDRGLCGAFNANIIKATLTLIREKYSRQQQQGNVTLMCIGKKGRDFFEKRGYKVISTYSEIFGTLNFDAARVAAEEAMQGFKAGDYDVIDVVYNEFKNVATQIIRRERLLPISLTAPPQPEKATAQQVDYIFEPGKGHIVSELLPKTLKIQFYKALLESNASEHGARMTAMDKATENAGELLKELKLTYNRTRQAAITKEILEIVGGAEALASS